jgi:hypothetical protein
MNMLKLAVPSLFSGARRSSQLQTLVANHLNQYRV